MNIFLAFVGAKHNLVATYELLFPVRPSPFSVEDSSNVRRITRTSLKLDVLHLIMFDNHTRIRVVMSYERTIRLDFSSKFFNYLNNPFNEGKLKIWSLEVHGLTMYMHMYKLTHQSACTLNNLTLTPNGLECGAVHCLWKII